MRLLWLQVRSTACVCQLLQRLARAGLPWRAPVAMVGGQQMHVPCNWTNTPICRPLQGT